MRLLTAPGVHRPISDTRMLAAALREQALPGGVVLNVHSSVNGAPATWTDWPRATGRLEAGGLLRPDQRDEEVVVVRGRRSP